MYKIGAQNKQFFHFPKSAEKRWIEVLDTSGILPSKLQNALICQDNFSENYFTSSQKIKFHRCPHQLFVPNSQCHKQIEDLMTMETTELVVIPDREVVPERAHVS
jgi:hypothetical protein